MSENQQITEQQAAENREKLATFYDEMIPVLEKQLKYQQLQTSIAVERAKQKQAEVAMAQMGAPEPKTTGNPEEQTDKKKQ